jgi:uncharacterized protein (DUF697 family)
LKRALARGAADGRESQMAQKAAETETIVRSDAIETTANANSVMRDAVRDELASKLVDRFTLWSGAAGLIPVPIVDVVAVAGLQIQMLRRLSEIYDVPFSENRGKSIVASIVGSLIPASSSAMTLGLVSTLKSFPGVGTAIALLMPGFSGYATWVIGKVFTKHLTSGGTLLDFNPRDYREFIRAQKEAFACHRRPAAQRGKRTIRNEAGQIARHPMLDREIGETKRHPSSQAQAACGQRRSAPTATS